MHRPPPRLLALAARLYAVLLLTYPLAFRERYSEDMAQVFRDGCRDAWTRHGTRGLLSWWLRACFDLVKTAIGQHRQAYIDRSPTLMRTPDASARPLLGLQWLLVYTGAAMLSAGLVLVMNTLSAPANNSAWASFWIGLESAIAATMIVGVGQALILKRTWSHLQIAQWSLVTAGAQLLGALVLLPLAGYWFATITDYYYDYDGRGGLFVPEPSGGVVLIFYGIWIVVAALVGAGVGGIQVRVARCAAAELRAWVRINAVSVAVSFLVTMVLIHMTPWVTQQFSTGTLRVWREAIVTRVRGTGLWDPILEGYLILIWLVFILLVGGISALRSYRLGRVTTSLRRS